MRIVFFGDSISYGELVSPHEIWATKCSAELCEAFPEKQIIVSNGSINGNTTRMGLERIEADVQQYSPNIVIVQFGLNDANYWQTDKGLPRVSIQAYEANLVEIVARCRAHGARHILLHTNHLTDKDGPLEAKCSKLAPYTFRENTRRYNEVIRKVAADHRCTLLDIESLWLEAIFNKGTNHGLLVADGIHLSRKGHDLYFNAVLPTLKNIVLTLEV